MFSVDEIKPKFREEIDAYIQANWGGPIIVTLGNAFDSSQLPGFMAVRDGKLVGAILYQFHGDSCEVAALFSLEQCIGIGRTLLNAVVQKAKKQGCQTIWLVTTNDNTRAMRFYQKYGFRLKAAHIGSFEEVKRIKNLDVEYGEDDIRIEHEMEFVYRL